MELKSPKAKKKPRPMCWRRMLRTPLLLLVLLGTSSCDHGDVNDVIETSDVDSSIGLRSFRHHNRSSDFTSDGLVYFRGERSGVSDVTLSLGFREGSKHNNTRGMSNGRFDFMEAPRLRHGASKPSNKSWDVLSDVKYLRRHLNRAKINFVISDVLVDGEAETRVHYNGVTAKETSVGGDG